MEQVSIFITRPNWSNLNLEFEFECYNPHRIAFDTRTQLIYVANRSMLTSSTRIISVTGEYTIALCDGYLGLQYT